MSRIISVSVCVVFLRTFQSRLTVDCQIVKNKNAIRKLRVPLTFFFTSERGKRNFKTVYGAHTVHGRLRLRSVAASGAIVGWSEEPINARFVYPAVVNRIRG